MAYLVYKDMDLKWVIGHGRRCRQGAWQPKNVHIDSVHGATVRDVIKKASKREIDVQDLLNRPGEYL